MFRRGGLSVKRCYVCDVGEAVDVEKHVSYGGFDGQEREVVVVLGLCESHQLMESWPMDSVEDFYANASDAMGVPSPFD